MSVKEASFVELVVGEGRRQNYTAISNAKSAAYKNKE